MTPVNIPRRLVEIDQLVDPYPTRLHNTIDTLFRRSMIPRDGSSAHALASTDAQPVLNVRFGPSSPHQLKLGTDRKTMWFRRIPDVTPPTALSRSAASDREQPDAKRRRIRTKKQQGLQDMLEMFQSK